MDVYRVENGERVLDQGGCVGTRLYCAAGNEYVHLAIAPGGEIPEHALPLAVSFCVLKGEGICAVAGAEAAVRAGEMVECPPDELRSWRNDSTVPLEVLVIKRAV
ncbi:cupin domain-containing protein [Pontiella sp.]|uniref:cupin domain-containing protein n=1 Tax=Pontiella sp. TaxID=2837462 RepID=UPI0035660B1B